MKRKIPKEYKLKKCWFLNKEFYVDKRVHIPRKNTEPLVKFAVEYIKRNKKRVVCADIGTGMGAIAISLILRSSFIKKVFATDIYSGAISVTRENIRKYNLKNKVIVKKGDLLKPIKNEKIDIIIANLPHASKEIFKKKKYLLFEHKKATLAGESGLEILESFLKQLSKYKYLKQISGIFLKISPTKKEESVKLIEKYLPNSNIKIKKDYERKNRFLIIQ